MTAMRTRTARLCGYAVVDGGGLVYVTRESDGSYAHGPSLAEALDTLSYADYYRRAAQQAQDEITRTS